MARFSGIRAATVLVLALAISGCQHLDPRRTNAAIDQSRLAVCTKLEKSLSEDIEIDVAGTASALGYGIGGRARYAVNYANDISEERLLALTYLISDCNQYAAGEMKPEDFKAAKIRSLSVLVSSDQVAGRNKSTEQIELRLAAVEEKFLGTSLDLSEQDIAAIRSAARSFSDAGSDSLSMIQQINQISERERLARLGQIEQTVIARDYLITQLSTRLRVLEAGMSSLRSRSTVEVSNPVNRDWTRVGVDQSKALYVYTAFFETGSAQLTPAQQQDLLDIADHLRSRRIVVEAFADVQGAERANHLLSTRRAVNTARFFQDTEVIVESSEGYGEVDVFPGGLAGNRRADVFVVSVD